MEYLYKLRNFMKSIFRTPTAYELAVTELEDAKRQLLTMQTALDYSNRMVDYHQDRIKRLNAYIINSGAEEAKQ